MKKIAICLVFFTLLLTACGFKKDDKTVDITSTSDKETVQKVVKEVTDGDEKSNSNEKIIKDVKENIINSQTNISKVKGKVQLYEGIYFDSKRYGEDRPNPYCEVVISNITDTSFDFTVNEVMILDSGDKREKKVIFLKNTAIFIGDGTKAAFYGKDYILNFEFPDDHREFPIVTDIKISGFEPLEGKIYLNNGIPGHEFG